jgi:hypothetical protein
VNHCSVETLAVSGGLLPGLTHLVCEDFILREHTMDRSLLSPVRITTGLFNNCAGMLGFDAHWHFQSPSDKSTVTDSHLKDLGLWFPGKQHARDAARHLVLFLKKYQMQLRNID